MALALKRRKGRRRRDSRVCDYCKISFGKDMIFSTCGFCKKNYCMYHYRPELHHCSRVDWKAQRDEKYKETEKRFETFKRNLELQYWTKQIAKGMILVLLIFVVLFNFGIFNPFEERCSDGTISNACSTNKPYFCKDGNFIYDAYRCGCPENQIIDNSLCRELRDCSDGTPHDSCSVNQPLFCYDGNMSPKASCGCPENYLFENNTCRIKVDCMDGTNDTECSADKPSYCYNGTLFNKASKCGCPEGYLRREENCLDPAIIEKEEAKLAFDYLNSIRSAYNRSQLLWNDNLYDLAVFRSKDMYERDYFDHVTPEGKCVKDFKGEYGLSKYTIAENAGAVYYGYDENDMEFAETIDEKEQIDGWMESRGHRYNLLYEKHTIGAIGCYKGVCVFLGGNTDPYGLGAGPCTTGDEGLEYWETVPTQPGEIK